MAMISDTGRVVEKYRYVGRVLKFNGTEERHIGRRRVLVAKVRARWPQTVDFEKGEFVNAVEEEQLVLWPSNYGTRNKRDQWVVYDGKTEAEVDAEWAGDSEENAIDLSAEMDEARTIAEALCAPAALS